MSRSHPDNIIQKRQRRARLLHSVYSWHRWLGLSVLLWVLMFSISGLLIEAGPALKLDRHKISSELLLKRYGVKAPQLISQWSTEDHQIDYWNQGISSGGEWLFQPDGQQNKVVGVSAELGIIVVVTESGLLLYSPSSDFIDAIPSPGGQLTKAGKDQNGNIVVAGTAGLFQADKALLNWREHSGSGVTWNTAQTSKAAQTPAPQHAITYERLLLDIHSGALFGPVGRWLSRLAAVVMILLAMTGFYTWFSRFARKTH